MNTMTLEHAQARANEIEDAIVRGKMDAYQVFTQMRQLISSTHLAQSAQAVDVEAIIKRYSPDKCPITGREFFMAIEHPERGWVATYGGPFDSYTIPEPDEDGGFRSERYDHDVGDWVEGGEPEPFELLAEREYNELHTRALSGEKAGPVGNELVFAHPAAVKSAAEFLLEQFDKRPCDNSGVSCCIRCTAVALSRWALAALPASPAPDKEG